MSTEKPLPFVYQFAAGAVAGVSEILIMYPLDVIKTRVQLQGRTPIPGQDHYSGMVDCFRKIVANEGASRLYRGITAPILMEAPKRATKFAANDEWGKVYRKMFGVEKMNQSLSIITGASAGATEAFVVVPFELVKIRLQDKAQAHKYNGMVDCVQKIVRQEGLLTLYQGLESTVWRHVMWNSGYFGCIFQIRAMLPANPNKDKSIQMRNDLISGSVGGTIGTVLNTPFDVVKSRIQNSPKQPGGVPKYGWAFGALGTVAKEEGFGALYKGFLPKVLRLGPGGGILLVVFTGVMDFFRKMRGDVDSDLETDDSQSSRENDRRERQAHSGPGNRDEDLDEQVQNLSLEDYEEPNHETLLGYSIDSLDKLLSPGRWSERKKFEVCLNGLTFVGHPVFALPDGDWTLKAHSKNQRPTEGDGDGKGISSSSDEQSLQPGQAGATITITAPSLRLQRAKGATSLGTSFNSASTTSGGASTEHIQMFHVVFVLAPGHQAQAGNVYAHVAKKLGMALHYCQKHLASYVTAESKKILAAKARAKQAKAAGKRLQTQIMEQSQLAWALKEIYDRLSVGEVAGIRLAGMEMSLQLPPQTTKETASNPSNEDVHRSDPSPHDALLLLQDKGTLLHELQSHGNASHLAFFLRELTPSKSLQKHATNLSFPLATILQFAGHLLEWRKARLVAPLHPRNLYTTGPHAPNADVVQLAGVYSRQFPGLPPLPQMMKMLSGRPIQYGLLIPSRDHRGPYMEVLGFLVRYGFVSRLRTFGWLGCGEHGHVQGLEQQQQQQQHQSQGRRRRLIILDPENMTEEEQTVVESIKEELVGGEVGENLNRLLPYLDGEHVLEDVAGQEEVKRAKVDQWFGALRASGHLVTFRSL
ncbi:hypothetical protein BTJ68_08413 [Hortaea werneckii EXF-2000]|uniref:Nitrogen permease regulator 3 n=2 Tax=Hortaea werneckii TaxID=91943 RepID=A0A1Z5T1N4_HORWE|nr:hypothetical protein BTJ68_08413 [Hortaea werneckii EXF-2000]